MTLPEPVSADVTGALREYWLARAAQHTTDSYAGIPLSKFPEDLRTYEHLLWESAPDTVIEIGTQAGGSALWFRDRLIDLRQYGRISRLPQVISVDIDHDAARDNLAHSYAEGIELVTGDVRDTTTVDAVAALANGRRCFVVEDSAHEYDTTYAALEGFARFVQPQGFFVVEDTCVDVDALRLDAQWPRGVVPALSDWLRTPAGGQFRVRRDLELYGVSCHPQGFLQRA